ncbi:hypothetical protein BKA69DRAFT_943740 [Paraphysoderma sedebokerense]|nr:hypothetical protein BKA69DRAFT_943740 [Paraphysoderma sedebokerense]
MSAITKTFGKSSLEDTEVRQSINLTTERIIALSRLIVGSPEFRDVLGDILDIGKQILKEEGVDVGEKGEKLGDIIREGGETSGTAVAEMAEKAGDMIKEGGAKAGAKLKKGSRKAEKSLKKGEVGKLSEETQSTFGQSRETASQKLSEMKEDIKSHVSDIPESTSDYISEARSKMQYHLEHLPEPQTSHLMESFQSLLRRIQSRPEYKDAVQTIVQLMRKSKESLQKVSEQLGTVGSEVTESENAKIAVDKAKQLVNNFASGGQSFAVASEGTLDDVIEKFGVVKDHIQGDEDFNEWGNELNDWIDYVFSLFDYQADKEPTKYWDRVKEQSKRLLSHTNYLLGERNLYSILDPLTASLSNSGSFR